MRGSPAGPAIVWRESWKEASRCMIQTHAWARLGALPLRAGMVFAVGDTPVEAAPNLEGEPHDGLQGRNGTIVVIGSPHGLTAAWTLAHNRLQGLGMGWGRAGCGTGHRYHLHR